MKALSLSRPWPYVFTDCNKRIENRGRAPDKTVINQRIALHAAKSWDVTGYHFIRELGFKPPGKHTAPQSQIFATCMLRGFVRSEFLVYPDQKQWFFGPVAWIVDDLIVLPEPVACGGKLGLWEIPPDVLDAVRKQMENGLERALFEQGHLTKINEPIADPYENREPIKVEGEPLSEQIVRDRR